MLINLSDIFSEQHKTIEETVSLEMTEFCSVSGNFAITKQEQIHFLAEYAGDHTVLISGSGNVTLLIPCDRCLADVAVKILLSFEKKVRMEDGQAVWDEETDETNYMDGYNLNVDQLICNELLIGWPTKVLCSEDCKGICNVCGQNLNEGTCDCEDTGLDPRMSVIRDMFKNFKEV